MDQFTLNYKDSPQLNTYPYGGVVEVLKQLEDKGITLAICSNRQQDNLERLVEKYFDEISFKYISGDTDGLHNKPDPYRINEIINKEKIDKNRVLYFGDKITDINAAKSACVDMILVSYGQGNYEAYSDSYPLRTIDNVEEILDL